MSEQIQQVQQVEGTISTVASNGQGILKHEKLVVFVPYTAPLDVVKVSICKDKGSYLQAEVSEWVKKSPFRTDPPCPHYGTCGGCQLQHIQYEKQAEIKQSFVTDALERIGKLSLSEIPVEMHPSERTLFYRRHIRLKLMPEDTGYIAGYTAVDGSFLKIDRCFLFLDAPLIEQIESCLKKITPQGEGSLRIVKTKERLLLLFETAFEMQEKEALAKVLLQLDSVSGVSFKTGPKKEHFGEKEGHIELLHLQLQFTSDVFLQNHPEESLLIYQKVVEKAKNSGAKQALDLYCGIGITSLLLADEMQVVGIEGNPSSIREAKKNAEKNKRSVTFLQGDVAKKIAPLLEKNSFDFALVNPPRMGLLPAVKEALIQHRVKNIAYISCQPATLARDLKEFVQSGYHIQSVDCYDMFPQTKHVETVVFLSL
ncbi:MAG: rRNA (Uracil-5-)-methyltransferase [Chlamydiales bacterium]|jgi:23S rRNA (uracil1939-C5)-methyltransferase|nr:rRNA (Uracil-5-)-methyltransferase [Chlamydiales bacterium]